MQNKIEILVGQVFFGNGDTNVEQKGQETNSFGARFHVRPSLSQESTFAAAKARGRQTVCKMKQIACAILLDRSLRRKQSWVLAGRGDALNEKELGAQKIAAGK
jgi:hypothetical protein